MPRVVLASASERRRALMSELFADFGVDLEFYTIEQPEPEPSTREEVRVQVESTCLEKAIAASFELDERGKLNPDLIVVSDTLVEDPDDSLVALGKPKDKIGATATLIRLSGRRHRVWSSTAILDRSMGDIEVGLGWWAKIWTDYSIVEFDEMSEEVMQDLIVSGSWIGKAGGYDMAGKARNSTSLVEGERMTVLGFSDRAIQELSNILL
ncbi:MAG: Maf family protein [Candidatus Thalassarchaeaceae archaeon]|nr:Maf family protein [Candidatus Thalassarchaeaceae archaeon]